MEKLDVPMKIKEACVKWCEQNKEKIYESYLFYSHNLEEVESYKFVVINKESDHDPELEKILFQFENEVDSKMKTGIFSTVLLPRLVSKELFVPIGEEVLWNEKEGKDGTR